MKPHVLTYPDTDSREYARARYLFLLQIIFGETIAIEYCNTIATFAPNEESRKFLLMQQKEEEKHLDLLMEYMNERARPHVSISKNLKKLDAIMSNAIERREYIECIFIQNFIVEGLNISLLQELAHHTDGVLSELSTKILSEEVGHMEFGICEITRILEEDKSPTLRKKLIWTQRKILVYGAGLAFTLAREAKYLGIPVHEFIEKTVTEHFERIERVGLKLPYIDKVLFNATRILLKIV